MKQKGFTLIEVLISLFIFSLLILGTSQLIIYSILAQDRCQNRLSSLSIASNQIEKLKSLDFDHPKLKEGSWEEETETGENKNKFLLKVEIKNISPSLKKLVVQCSPQNQHDKKVALAVYISKEMGF